MKIIYWPSPMLSKMSDALTEAPSPEMVAGMRGVMRQAGGVGLSAIQVGIPLRLVVTSTKVFVNPVIEEHLGQLNLVDEGCLSVPGFSEEIKRYPEVIVTYRDENFQLHERELFTGQMAHILQHELEHLDGKLYLDHLNAARRSTIKGNMMALRRAGKLK